MLNVYDHGYPENRIKIELENLEPRLLVGNDISGRIAECQLQVDAWIKVKEFSHAENWIKKAIQASLGIGYRKDYQFNIWTQWLIKINDSDYPGANDRLLWFLGQLAHIKETAERKQSTTDDKPYESKGLGDGFPYDLKKFLGKNYGAIASTPHGNSFTFDMAKAALDGEKLGADAITDILAISLSSPDYIGHSFGPNSIEQEDDFLRLDKDLGDFLSFLDSKVGTGQYMVFLSADHGVAHIPGFMKENKLPGGSFSAGSLAEQLNQQLKDKYGKESLVVSDDNYQFTLDDSLIKITKLNKDEISGFIIDFLTKQPSVARAFAINKMMETPLNSTIKEMLVNGYYPIRGGDIQVILHSNWIESFGSGGTTHGAWAPYDSHIPLLWYGWGIKAGKTNRETYMTDIAPTIAAMLHIQMPSGNIGKVITEIAK